MSDSALPLHLFILKIMGSLEDPEDVDLNCVNVENADPRQLVAILRTCFLHKEQVKGWYGLKARTREYLAREGFDASSILKGL